MIGQQIMELMKKLETLDERSRMDFCSHVDEQRDELLAVLIRHLNTTTSASIKTAAIYLIGRHRLSNGVRELIKQIDFDSESQSRGSPLPLWGQYPAMEALIHIGQPAVSAAIELLAADMNNLRRDLAVKVIRYVENAEIARFILAQAQSNETDQNRKANFQDAIDRLDKLPK
jgi:hypothetical protein